MNEKLTASAQKALTMENTLKDFGVKPVEGKREEIYKHLLAEKEQFLAIERVRGKAQDRDISR